MRKITYLSFYFFQDLRRHNQKKSGFTTDQHPVLKPGTGLKSKLIKI